ncbi:MAG: hypothetical protein JWO65_1658 [Sphingomonas bacterium]|nr:hypothetical protein [Sphingomonas bacterium]
MDRLRYSPLGVIGYCAQLVLVVGAAIALVVFRDTHRPVSLHGNLAILAAVLAALFLYAMAIQIVRMLMLLRHGGAAFAADGQGLAVHTTWVARRIAWPDVIAVTFARRSTRNGYYFVVAVDYREGVRKRRTEARVRWLEGTQTDIAAWVDRAEAMRLAHGGAPVPVPSNWFARWMRNRMLSRDGIR